MVVDMVRDLELDHSPSGLDTPADVTPDRVESVRTYLSCYYLLTMFISTWPKLRNANDNIKITPWTSTCWAALPAASSHPQDAALAQLARHAYIIREASDASRKMRADDNQLRLVMLGLEAQLHEWKAQVPEGAALSKPVLLGQLFAEIFVYCAPLVKFSAQEDFADTLTPELGRVALAVPLLRRFFEEAASVDLMGFSAGDWGRLVICVILAMRLSFPTNCFPGWDYTSARTQLGFGEFLDAVSTGAEESPEGTHGTSRVMDIGRASGVIFDVVRNKYHGRLERETMLEDATRSTCPMLDGSLDEYLRTWDEGPGCSSGIFGPSNAPIDTGSASAPEGLGRTWGNEHVGLEYAAPGRQVYHDLWATMTMSWAEKDTGTHL